MRGVVVVRMRYDSTTHPPRGSLRRMRERRVPYPKHIKMYACVHALVASHVELLGGLWLALVGAIRAFEVATSAHPGHRLLGNDVSARHHHGRVFVGRLFFRNRAYKDGVKAIARRQRDLDLLIISTVTSLARTGRQTGSSCCVVHSVRFFSMMV